MSLPLRECGLKSQFGKSDAKPTKVTPLAGVWIEILQEQGLFEDFVVTPLAGVWIEIMLHFGNRLITRSLPLRECRLK